jgi:hypothetical protein
VALHNISAVLAHVIQSSERALFLCNWEQPVEGERERSLSFLEAVLPTLLERTLLRIVSPCIAPSAMQFAL